MFKRTILTDVVQGIIIGGVLAFITRIFSSTRKSKPCRRRYGWSITLQCGKLNNDILLRPPAPGTSRRQPAGRGRLLDGDPDGAGRYAQWQHDYLLHFPTGGAAANQCLLVADHDDSGAPWSLTPSSVRRQRQVRPPPGPMDLLTSISRNPAPVGHEANWLPAPAGTSC